MARFANFTAEVRDAVSVRTAALVVGVLLVQLAFVASYVGAFHRPTPHDLSLGVVVPGGQAPAVVQQLDALPGHPVSARVVADRAAAVRQVRAGDLVAALVVDPAAAKDELVVASGGGAALVTAVEQVATVLEARQQRSFASTDVVPLQGGDARGLTGFYLVVGWLVGGYLVASLLGVAKGARPANLSRALIRLAVMLPYAVLSGLGGALIVDPGLDALTGHFWALAGLGMLLVLSSATVTLALQVLFGTIGIGLTVLLFVVLGNPSAGGAYQSHLLPGFWRYTGPWIPNGAGTDAVRRIVYFHGTDTAGPVLLIAAYALAGALVTVLAVLWRRPPAGAAVAGAGA